MTVRTEGIAEGLAGRPALLRDACARALAYLDGLTDRPVAPAAADVAALGRLDFALPGAEEKLHIPGKVVNSTQWESRFAVAFEVRAKDRQAVILFVSLQTSGRGS